MRKSLAALLALALACALLLGGCMPAAPEEELRVEVALPEVPKDLERDESGVPLLRVYDTEAQAVCEMDIETYVMGVLAGEMNNSWPQEALKAQAILARTFVLKFIETKESSYPGADISTDVREAQAYSEVNINENVRTAVEETRGEVVSYDAELVQAWFHAHAGGMTELPSVALEYKQEDPPYLVPTSSNDSPDAPQSVQSWTAKFDADAFAQACADTGVRVGEIRSVEIGATGESGRAATLLVNGKEVSAPSLRLQLGANEMKSTLLEKIELRDSQVVMQGRGFGHGVGLSQWGAYQMAQEGKTAQEIVRHYFRDVDIVRLWE